ncbi:hypothetical protein F6X37_12855 [Paraburkholderia sp. 31.1]|uniref:hypothetical protein n=1 Tax=Paraburkholderia sp. 31.1 TaxID=2615205 RepID=UPI001654E76A|nr:hypothetical protein [Paraburkholderia sp. 31.1]MBC8722460.1 hypothetical protein [Paraburkholderia sp. 31.1]
MSSHRSPSNGIEVPILAGAAAFLGFCFWIAQISGASLASVMKSAFGLIGLAVVVGGALWWLKDYFFIGAAFYLVVGWRVVWPVLDSIAAGGHEGEDWPLMPYENTFIASGWLNWSVESILIAVFIYGISRRGRDSYYAR